MIIRGITCVCSACVVFLLPYLSRVFSCLVYVLCVCMYVKHLLVSQVPLAAVAMYGTATGSNLLQIC